jgi:hypothetical protein
MLSRGLFLTASAILLTGCGAVSPVHSGSPKPAASAVSQVTVRLSGLQLAGLLLSRSAMPAGYSLLPLQGATQNSGKKAAPRDAPAPAPSGQLCQAFAYSNFIAAGEISDTVFAQTAFANAKDTTEVDQSVDVFTGSDAQTVMQRLWTALGTCAHFSYNDNGPMVHATLTRGRLTGIGDEAIDAVSRSPIIIGQATLIAVRVGNAIVTVMSSAAGPNNESAAIGYARQITANLRSAAAG